MRGVTFAAATAASQSTIDATVTVTATAATGGSSVTVSQSGATATCAGCLTVAAPPTVTGLSMPKLAQGASHAAVITGTGFYPGAKIRFKGPGKGVTATVTSVSPTSISATIKAARTTPAGQYSLALANGDGGKATLASALTVVQPPTITGILQVGSAPPVGPGQSVTVTDGPGGGYGTATDPGLTINTG